MDFLLRCTPTLNTLNQIRKKKASVTDKILEYFRKMPGKRITCEQLR